VNKDDLILVSVDDHVVEPPDMFEAHVPAKWREQAPRVERTKRGTEVWVYEDNTVPNIGLNAVAGRSKDEYGVEPTNFDEIRPGCWDIHERIKDMNAGGVLGSMNFPSFPGFAGRLFAHSKNLDVSLHMVRAYNDWHIDEWCGTYPGRMIPLAIPILWDVDHLAGEVRRVAGKGCRAITFPENPEPLGFPSLHSDHWDPFWAACQDTGTVVCMHIGSSGQLAVTAKDAPVDVMITLQPINIVQCAADLVWSRVLREFPGLKIALSEGGIGWIPYFLERIDRTYDMHHVWTGQEYGDKLPSEVFRRNIITCFIADRIGLKVLDDVGVDTVTWECDYPHSDTAWPTGPEALTDAFGAAGLTDVQVAKITHENAIRLFSYDPFAHVAREDATVGALRAQAEGRDLTTRSKGTRKKKSGKSVTAADVQRRATA
jgi:predicted TIM-barrel fold metal-dependent hydrolase